MAEVARKNDWYNRHERIARTRNANENKGNTREK